MATRVKFRRRKKPQPLAVAAAVSAARSALVTALAAERERWSLWLPLALALGAAAYFAVPTEPAPFLAPLGFLVAAGASFALRRSGGAVRGAAAALCALAAAACAGATAGEVRTALAATPRLGHATEPVRVTGWVLAAEPGASRPHVDLLVAAIEADVPKVRRLRLLLADAMPPGRAVSCLAILRPPEGPLAPHGYDSAFGAYFGGVGASGFALGRCRPIALAPPPRLLDRWTLKLAAWRRDLAETVAAATPGEGGAIAAALVAGDRSLMAPETNAAFRDSGLAHMLSVSGLHMSLAAGGVFALFHAFFALIPPLALRFPIRKWAATAALLAGAAYLVVSGVSVAAERAFIMTAVALGAVLVDRPALTLRALGLSAVAILLLQPEAVLDPGFQMSFAATAALLAAFEARPKREIPGWAPGLILGGLDRAWNGVSSMLLASVVAGLATDPFALFHFQRVALYGLPANLATAPIVSFVVAPAAVGAAILAPFGLADLPLHVMGAALDLVGRVGAAFADRPEAVRAAPAMSEAAFLLATLAILWACIWRGALRWGGAVFLAAAIGLYATEAKPVLWADGDLRSVVSRARGDTGGDAGWRTLADPRRGAFATSRLAGLAGLSPLQAEKLAPAAACERGACAWRLPGGRLVVRVLTAEGFASACVRGAIVLADPIASPEFGARCGPALLADPTDRARYGGVSVIETGHGLVVRRAADGRRRWSGALTRSGE